MTGFLLDTNVPSELVRSLPDPKVKAWVLAQDNRSLFLSVVSIGELRKGFTIMPDRKRRAQLEVWLDKRLLPLFADRVLPVTQAICKQMGRT